jgi:C1A family cysteine protease
LTNALQAAPISVAVDASNWSLYRGGILGACGTAINHGVLVVGSTKEFWKVKNSWGTAWGENGFIRLQYGNTCDVCLYASYPIL